MHLTHTIHRYIHTYIHTYIQTYVPHIPSHTYHATSLARSINHKVAQQHITIRLAPILSSFDWPGSHFYLPLLFQVVQQRLRGVAAVEHIASEEMAVLEAAAAQAAIRGAEREGLVLQRMASTLELNRQQQLLEEAHAAEKVIQPPLVLVPRIYILSQGADRPRLPHAAEEVMRRGTQL